MPPEEIPQPNQKSPNVLVAQKITASLNAITIAKQKALQKNPSKISNPRM